MILLPKTTYKALKIKKIENTSNCDKRALDLPQF